jgi:hypothetical protein
VGNKVGIERGPGANRKEGACQTWPGEKRTAREWTSTRLHGATTQKTAILELLLVSKQKMNTPSWNNDLFQMK